MSALPARSAALLRPFGRCRRSPPTPARIAASSTRCTATRTRTWSPTRPRIRSKWKNPSTLVFTYTPVEDPAVYENVFKPFTTHLAQVHSTRRSCSTRCSRTPRRSRRCAPAACTSADSRPGPTGFRRQPRRRRAVRDQGHGEGIPGLQPDRDREGELSPTRSSSDLKGKKVAHTSPSSNSGHLAPLALFPAEGLAPDKDYKLVFSGKHDQSVHRRGLRRLRRRAGRLRRVPPHGRARRRSRRPTSASSTAARNSRRRRSPMRTTSSPSSRQDARAASTTTASRRRCRRRSTAPTASSRSTTRSDWAVVRKVAEGSGGGFNKARTRRKRRARKRRARSSRRRNSACVGAAADAPALSPQPRKEYRARQAGAARTSISRSRATRHHGGHRPVGHRQVARSSAASTGWSSRPPGEILFDGQRPRAARPARAARGAAPHRHGVPGIQPRRAPDRDGEPAVAAGSATSRRGSAWLRAFPQDDIARAFELLDTVGLAGFAQRSAPTRCPAASASASASRAR